MNDKKTLEIALFLRFSARKRENIRHDMNSILELIDDGGLPPGLPLHWNFPVHPLLSGEPSGDNGGNDHILNAIRKRISGGNDVILPMGYAGAYHSLLTDEELRQEVNWTYSNPRASGFRDKLNIEPKLMMPAQMDFLRPASRSFYNNSGYTWISVPNPCAKQRDGQVLLKNLEILDHGNMYYFPLLSMSASIQDVGKALKKIVRREAGPFALLFDFTTGDETEKLSSFYASVEKALQKIEVKFISLHRWLLPDRRQDLTHPRGNSQTECRIPGTTLPHLTPPHSPADRIPRLEGEKKRYFLSKQEIEYDIEEHRRKILIAESSCKNSEIVERKPDSGEYSTPVERALIADMPGTVVIKEYNFEAEFINGRFKNIISGGRPLLSGHKANSYLEIDGSRYEFENAGVYSFESEEVRGLRETLLLCTPYTLNEGKIVIDYLFAGEHPALFISVDIQYPSFTAPRSIDAYAPLEIPLFRCSHNDTLSCSGLYPDGTSYSLTLPCSDGIYGLPGDRFVIRQEDAEFSISYPPIHNFPVEILPVKLCRNKKDGILYINPKGSYRAGGSQFIHDLTEHFTLMVSAGTGETKPHPVPEAVIAQLQEPWLGIREK